MLHLPLSPAVPVPSSLRAEMPWPVSPRMYLPALWRSSLWVARGFPAIKPITWSFFSTQPSQNLSLGSWYAVIFTTPSVATRERIRSRTCLSVLKLVRYPRLSSKTSWPACLVGSQGSAARGLGAALGAWRLGHLVYLLVSLLF